MMRPDKKLIKGQFTSSKMNQSTTLAVDINSLLFLLTTTPIFDGLHKGDIVSYLASTC